MATAALPAPAPRRDPIAALLTRPSARFVLLLVLAAFSRWTYFGDLSYHNDEVFYFTAAQRLHDGLSLYTQVWDRKGPGLFLTYWLIAGVSRDVLAFQIAACVSAAATAFIVTRLARRMASPFGAMLSGVLYLAGLPMFCGGGGQSPVFYNLWIALAVLLLVRAGPALRRGNVTATALAAMASAGFALTFKQSAAPEAVCFGLIAAAWLARDSVRTAVFGGGQLALAGMAPFAVATLYFAATGRMAAFWQAMVTANLRKTYNPWGDALARLDALGWMGLPLLLLCAAGLVLLWRRGHPLRLVVTAWVIAAFVGAGMLPNLYDHYMLPLIAPLALAAAPALDRRPLGLVLAGAAALYLLGNSGALALTERAQARAEMRALADEIRTRDPAPRLLVYQGPGYLNAMVGSFPPSPLLASFHLYFPAEDNVSPFDTAAEMRRNLAWQPTVVVLNHAWPSDQENARTAPLVRAYVRERCRLWGTRKWREVFEVHEVDVYGDCRSSSGAAVATGRKFQRSARLPSSIAVSAINSCPSRQ